MKDVEYTKKNVLFGITYKKVDRRKKVWIG